mmetsp:Transcript_2330/g.3673  ORF Transcript_2330/g.3673 Transcript_2330/m.3673 type:complete len:211 (+) Transcript_2330:55-687(+)
MDYKEVINTYDCDGIVLLGRFSKISDYVKDFGALQDGRGLDIGAGPGGGNYVHFPKVTSLDACDADESVVASLSPKIYNRCFMHKLGSSQALPFADGAVDFVVCTFVVHHLSNEGELDSSLKEISRVLRPSGGFFFMFKAGSHDTDVVHYSEYYETVRSIRVFDPEKVLILAAQHKMHTRSDLDQVSNEIFIDSNYLANCCLVLRKSGDW